MGDRSHLCPRLIDYLVLIGRRNVGRSTSISTSNSGESTAPNRVHNPEILRRYPENNHKDFPLPPEVTFFCQPEGCLTYTGKRVMPTFRDTNSFVFALTDKETSRIRYGICINFYRQFEKRTSDCKSPPGPTLNTPQENKKKRTINHTLTSLCLISHHPFFVKFEETVDVLRRLIDACNLRVQHIKKCGGSRHAANYKDSVWSVLTGLWQENIPPILMTEIREIEQWIMHALSAPVPVPGKTRVEMSILPHYLHEPLEFALPDKTRLSLIDLPLHLPLELLHVENVVRVLTCVMLEYKVVLQSRNYNYVSKCCLALSAMLYPLEYMFPVIPLLPTQMPQAEQLLVAPTPFIIGVPASFFKVKNMSKLPDDVVLVDLDTNKVILTKSTPYPELPEPEFSHLLNNLRQALNALNLSKEGTKDSDESADRCDVALRVAMIKFFNSPNVLANFAEHTRTLRLYPRPVVALQQDSFVRSRPIKTDFVLQLARTQAVEYFAECSLCPKNQAYLRVQNGVVDAERIGDKSRWYAENLQPVHFEIYKENSTLGAAWDSAKNSNKEETNTDESGGSGSEAANKSLSTSSSLSSISDLVFESNVEDDLSRIKPLCAQSSQHYHAPLHLEVPNDSGADLESPYNEGRASSSSSRCSSRNSRANELLDSDADFAKMAENLAIKAQPNNNDTWENVHVVTSNYERQETRPLTLRKPSEEKLKSPTQKKWSDTINGISDRTENLFTKMMLGKPSQTEHKQKKEKVIEKPSLEGATHTHRPHKAKQQQEHADAASAEKAAQQSKNQQSVKEICDGVVKGQGVGLLTFPKLRRLMEDESLRDLACTRLNLGLDIKHLSEEDYLPEIHLDRQTYKGYLRVLTACIAGIEQQYSAPGATGLASTLCVMEIAHRHFWAREVLMPSTTSSGNIISILSPSASVQDLTLENELKSQNKMTSKSHHDIHAALSKEEKRTILPGTMKHDSLEKKVPNVSTPTEQEKAENANIIKTFLYQDFISNGLWSKMQFWEDVFYDAVAQEREIIGMDMEPIEMMDRYKSLSETERKRLEMDEDRLLATLMHNMTAFMVMCGAPVRQIQQKIRRLLGKSHVGLVHSQAINHMLESLHNLSGNMIPLKPVGSRLMQKQTFPVHQGSDANSPLVFMDVCDDALVVKAINGSIVERWWYERLVNMTFSPKTKVLCLWRRSNDSVQLCMFYTKKCRDLYDCIKQSMERAAARGKAPLPCRDLGGEFPIVDLDNKQSGLLQVRIDGLALTFAADKQFINLSHIKKCNTQNSNIFVLEQLDANSNELIEKRYESQMAYEIARQLHRIISVHVEMYRVRIICKRAIMHRQQITRADNTTNDACQADNNPIMPDLVPLIAQHIQIQ